MSEVIPKLSPPREDVSLNRGDLRGGQTAGVDPAALHDLAHDLRQPLGVIESLAYYLELTSSDPRAAGHLRRIQAMVLQANRILDRSCAA
jgi:signal transduction histidine kinase